MARSKQQQLDALQRQIVADNVCPELAASSTQLVFGEGNPDAAIVFVGEAPGKNEDKRGVPFVGAAGKFLDEMLSLISLKRSDVYVTNIVKYRPPNNRDPLPQERSAFLKYLQKQIDIIKPRLIVTLGRHSMECFLPGLKISQVHGEPRFSNGYSYLPLYHPAAALYNGGLRQTLKDDFLRLPAIVKQLQESKNISNKKG